MSDPMTNTEVEDVLASIRRLVSDDKRPEIQEEKAGATDRLVLTPSLRVMDDPEPEARSEADEAAIEAEVAWAALDQAQNSEDVASQTELEVAENFEKHAIEDVASEEMASIQGAFVDLADDDEPETTDVEVTADAQTHEPVQDDEQHSGLASNELDEPDQTDGTAGAVPSEDLASESEPEELSNADMETQSLSEKIAALETLIAGQADDYEPETAGDGDNAGTEPPTLEWEDADDTDDMDVQQAESEIHDHVVEDALDDEEEITQVFSSDEDVLDEEALRELVSDIVREELQGALGERITRNVRKLVRREIHRALAAQELE